MDRIDKRIWYAVAAVVVVLLLAWLLGWFGGAEAPPPRRPRPGEIGAAAAGEAVMPVLVTTLDELRRHLAPVLAGRALTALLLAFLVLLVQPAAAAAGEERRVALVIGNAAYRHADPLANPLNDAQAVAAKLRQIGFAEVTVETDRGIDAIRRALRAFAGRAEGADLAVVFYAGHGISVDGQSWLVPVDAELARDRDVEYEAVPLSLVQNAAAGARRLSLVVLDACRNNPFTRRLSRGGGKRSIGRGLPEPQDLPVNRLVAYAAKDGSVAADGAPGGHSPFTAALLEHLGSPGLEVGLLFRKVRDTVAARTDPVQEPWLYGSLSADSFYLVPPPPEPEPPPAPPAVVAAPASPDYGGRDRVMFEVIRDSARAQDFAIFLEGFPESPLAPLARSRLEELQGAEGERTTTAALPPAQATEPPPEPAPAAAPALPPSPAEVEAALGLGRADWRRLQDALTALGFDTRGSDGKPGPNTRR